MPIGRVGAWAVREAVALADDGTLQVAGEGQRIFLRHDPVRDWSGDAWHLHGHSHGTIGHDLATGRVDVGVDCWDFKPVSLEELAVEIGVPA